MDKDFICYKIMITYTNAERKHSYKGFISKYRSESDEFKSFLNNYFNTELKVSPENIIADGTYEAYVTREMWNDSELRDDIMGLITDKEKCK